MMKAIILARVSTEDQKEDGTSLDGQITSALAYIERKGYMLETRCGFAGKGLEHAPGVFQEDHTGKTAIRPSVNAALDAVEKYSVGVVVLKNTRRLGRRAVVQEALENDFLAHGARVEYTDATFDRSTVSGRSMRRVQGMFDEMDYENVIEQLREGKYNRARAGSVVTTHAPYGYTIVKERDARGKPIHRLVIVETEAEIVRTIFDWYVHGDLSIIEIVTRLTAQRIPTRWDTLGLKRRKHSVGVWNDHIVFRILHDETCAGTWYFGRTKRAPIPGTDKTKQVNAPREDWIGVPVPAIVERALWEAAQKCFAHNADRAQRNRKYTYLFSGMMACDVCKCRYVGFDGNRPTRGYRCCGRYKHEDRCEMTAYTESELDTKIWTWVGDISTNIERVESTLNQRQTDVDEQNKRTSRSIAGIDRLIADKNAERERVFMLYKKGRLDADRWAQEDAVCAKELTDLESEKTNTQAQLVKPHYTPEYFADIKQLCRNIITGFRFFTAEEKREAYELLDLTVTLAIEDGYKIAYVECVIDKERLEIGLTKKVIACILC